MSDDFTPEQVAAWIGTLPITYRPSDVADRLRDEFLPKPPIELPTATGTVIAIDGQWWLLDQDGSWKRGPSEFTATDLIGRLGVTEYTTIATPTGGAS